jgi:hypothetical protein
VHFNVQFITGHMLKYGIQRNTYTQKEIPSVFKNGGKGPHFSQIDAENYLFYNSE